MYSHRFIIFLHSSKKGLFICTSNNMQPSIDAENRFDSFFFLQAKQMNGNGELFRQKYPKLGVRIVDGSGLATGVVLNSIPSDAKQVFLHKGTSKIARAVAMTLCGRGIQVYPYLPSIVSLLLWVKVF